MRKNIIKALMVEPGKHPKVTYLSTTIEALKSAVNIGTDETGNVKAKRIRKNIYAVFNSQGFLCDLEANRRIGKDIIAGIFYIVSTDKDSFPISLTDKEIEKYMSRFWMPETFDDLDIMDMNIYYLREFYEKLKNEEL